MKKIFGVIIMLFVIVGFIGATNYVMLEIVEDNNNTSVMPMDEDEFNELLEQYPEEIYNLTEAEEEELEDMAEEMFGYEEMEIPEDFYDDFEPADIELEEHFVYPGQDYNDARGGLDR